MALGIFIFMLVLPYMYAGDKELVLSQIIWRHGDRSPTKTFPSDIHQEGDWKFGGGGWGQLSPTGMRQHFNLGTRLKNRYVSSGYLSPFYNSKEIYVRSTDVNRTVISAMSNLIGMYSNQQNRVGIDYPDVQGWPANYVPIAVHTVDDDSDYILNADATCMRQTKLWDMAKTSDEVRAFVNQTTTQQVLATTTKNCNETVDIDNLWIINDAIFIEGIHFPNNPNTWVTADLAANISQVNDKVEEFQNGIFDKKVVMNNLDIGLELQKLRGGSCVNDVLMHMNLKKDCYGKSTNACKWINNLKYYVYSAHDTTIYAFLTCFGIELSAVKTGYPHYSAAVLTELYRDKTTNEFSFKMFYHSDEGQDFSILSDKIDGCTQDYCDLKHFSDVAARVKPDRDMNEWCNVDPSYKSGNSFFTAGIIAFVALIHQMM
ncbi:unnamed protein product [Auanema sp. JU1783]|nr:unnamed protein product [Auanema sp. JU1783]